MKLSGDYTGDTISQVIPMTLAGTPFEADANWHLIFTAKLNPGDSDDAALFQKSTGAGITTSDTDATVSLIPADTVNLGAPYRFYWDIKARHLGDGRRHTLASGTWVFEPGITREDETSVAIHTTEEPQPQAVTAAAMLAAVTAGTEIADPAEPAGTDKIALFGTGLAWLTWTRLKALVAGAGASAWDAITGKPETFPPTGHKTSHATGGGDALTAADIGAVAVSGNETIAGAKTFSGQVQMTGQSMTDANSAMTLGNSRGMRHMARGIFGLCAGSASGTGATPRRTATAGCIDGDLSTGAVAGAYYRVSWPGFINGGPGNTGLDFRQKWELMLRLGLSMSANTTIYGCFGADGSGGIPATATAAIGFELTAANAIRLWRCAAGAPVYSDAAVISGVPAAYPFTGEHFLWLENTGAGTVNLYIAYREWGAAMPLKPAAASCAVSGVPASWAGAAGHGVFLRATGTPGGFTSLGLFDAQVTEFL